MGFFRYIFENGLYDEEFVKYWTNLPFLVDPDTKMPVLAGELFPDYVSPTPENTPAYVCFDARTNGVQPFPFSASADSPVDPEVFKTVEFGGKSYKTAGQIYREEAEPWTLEKVGETCWLDPEDIESAIRIYADAKVAGISNGVFSDQMECGVPGDHRLSGPGHGHGLREQARCHADAEQGSRQEAPHGEAHVPRPGSRPVRQRRHHRPDGSREPGGIRQ